MNVLRGKPEVYSEEFIVLPEFFILDYYSFEKLKKERYSFPKYGGKDINSIPELGGLEQALLINSFPYISGISVGFQIRDIRPKLWPHLCFL